MARKESFLRAALPVNATPITLSAYYAGPSDPALRHDLQTLSGMADAFSEDLRGKVAGLTPGQLGEALAEYDAVYQLIEKIEAYRYALVSIDTTDRTVQVMDKRALEILTSVRNRIVFFPLELSRMPPDALSRACTSSPAVARHEAFLRAQSRNAPFLKTEAEENTLAALSTQADRMWAFYRRLTAATAYDYDGQTLQEREIFRRLFSEDRDDREKAFCGITAGLETMEARLTRVFNRLVRNKTARDAARGHVHVVAERNLTNDLEDEIVGMMTDTVRANYARLSHRYYAIKAAYMGLDRLAAWDCGAPVGPQDELLPFDTAQRAVEDANADFHPEMGETARDFFRNGWIDAGMRPGKDPGSFSHPGSVLTHPVVMVNWRGTVRDLMVLAHEIGHGVQQRLAALHLRRQLMSELPLPLAETCAVFGEQLAFERLLAEERDPSRRVALLFSRLDYRIDSLTGSIAAHTFETRAHEKIRDEGRPLAAGEIRALYLEAQNEAFGPAVRLDDKSGLFWETVGQFIEMPFHAYAYAFGDCLAHALYDQYQAAGDKDAFARRYLTFQQTGGTQHHSALLAPFGIDLTDSAFWQGAVERFAQEIDRLEAAIQVEQLQLTTGTDTNPLQKTPSFL